MLASNILFLLLSLNQGDTLNFKTKDINVEETYSLRSLKSANLITKNLDSISGFALEEILGQTTGIYIRDYGGLGGLKTVSLRGNTASQTAILYNGFKLNSAQNGLFDFSNISANQFDEVQIVKSGNSTVYGANSAGGTINLKNKVNYGFQGQIKIASFDTESLHLSWGDEVSNWSYEIDASYDNSLSNFPIEYSILGETINNRRANASSTRLNACFSLEKSFTNSHLNINYTNWWNDKEIPNALLDGSRNITNQSIFDLQHLISAKYYNRIADIGFLYRKNTQIFEDVIAGQQNFGFTQSEFITNELQFYTEKAFNYKLVSNNIRFDFTGTNLSGNMADPNSLDNYRRINVGLSSNNKFSISDDLKLYSGIRYDYLSDTDDFLSLSIESNYEINDFFFDFNISRNFRPPSFNEMYFLNFGNLNLRNEQSVNVDLATTYEISFIKLEASLFYSEVDDKILAIPSSPILWSAQNVDETLNYGIENSISLDISFFEFLINYSRIISIDTETKRQLPYQPEEVLFSSLEFKYKGFSLLTSVDYNSFRYTLQNSNNPILDSFTLINLGLGYTFNEYSINFRANNIFDEMYQIIYNFPMPGINFAIQTRYNL